MLPTLKEIDAYCVRRFNAAPSSTIPGCAIWGNEPDDCRRGYYEFLADAAHELGLPTPEYLDWG